MTAQPTTRPVSRRHTPAPLSTDALVVTAVVPAYDEEATIEESIARFRQAGLKVV